MRSIHPSPAGVWSCLASGLAIPLVAVALATLAAAAPTVVNSEPLPPEQQRAQFKLPPGFDIPTAAP